MRTLPLQLRFNDVDLMGHVNNAVILEYFDLGKSEYLTALGLPPELGDFTVMVVHLEVDFTNQIRFRDSISVQTAVKRIGNKSLEVFQQVLKDDGTVCATCKTIMAGYCRSMGASAPITEQLRSAIAKEEGNALKV